jgi:PAT family beta-lactamase induction signal transducer AmpG
VLPVPESDHAVAAGHGVVAGFLETFAAFFRRPGIATILAFLLMFRFAEAQGLKMVTPFLLDPVARGGLGLTTAEVGIAYGTVGAIALTVGGILGGLAISRHGLRAWLWPMTFAMHVPNLAFVYLATVQPRDMTFVAATLALEQFGYGFGFAAYLLYMILVSEGAYKTAHYAICTGFMALGMMLPGMASGWIQEQLGYASFFVWVCAATLPAFLVVALVKVPPGFGAKDRPA